MLKIPSQIPQFLTRLPRNKTIFFGEYHLNPAILSAQINCIKQLANSHNVVLEMFNYSQQHLLDEYSSNSISMPQLKEEYAKSKEGFDLDHYGQLLDVAKQMNVNVYAGFIPRELAARMVREDEEVVLADMIQQGYGDVVEMFRTHPGSKEHYEYFCSLVGSDNERIKKLFKAQLLKDASLAVAAKRAEPSIVICGCGHSDFRFGGPERYGESCVVTCKFFDDDIQANMANIILIIEP